MRRFMNPRNWLIGAGAVALLVAGGLAAGPVASLAQQATGADLSEDEAAEIAVREYPDATVLYIEADDEDGAPVYEVALSNGYDLEIDGNSGDILETDRDDDDGELDDDRDDWSETGTLDDGNSLLPEAAVSPEEAVATAQGEVDGRVDDVELERYRGDLIYAIEIGNQEVLVDAMTGEVVAVHNDD